VAGTSTRCDSPAAVTVSGANVSGTSLPGMYGSSRYARVQRSVPSGSFSTVAGPLGCTFHASAPGGCRIVSGTFTTSGPGPTTATVAVTGSESRTAGWLRVTVAVGFTSALRG